MTAARDAYMAAAARLGCRLCGRYLIAAGMTRAGAERKLLDAPCALHHPRTGVGAARRADDRDVIPICGDHHQNGERAIHRMGRKAFEDLWGVTEGELTAETQRLVRERYGLEPPPATPSKIMPRRVA